MNISLMITSLTVIVFVVVTYMRIQNQKNKLVKNETVYIDKGCKKSTTYHKRINCSLISESVEPIVLKEAKKRGFETCGNCN